MKQNLVTVAVVLFVAVLLTGCANVNAQSKQEDIGTWALYDISLGGQGGTAGAEALLRNRK